MNDTSATVMVVGASRGLGRGVADAFAERGHPVVAVSRTGAGPSGARSVRADAADADAAGRLLDEYEPRILVLTAGATPLMRPLHHHTWETFSANWESDVRIAFGWVRETLLRPMPPGSRVIVFSSGAALNGSPLSGGYAGAKAAQRLLVAYARDESERAGLAITFTAVLPRLTPLTDLGRRAAQAYARRAGTNTPDPGPHLTPEEAGTAVLTLVETKPADVEAAYLLTAGGLRSLP